MVNPLNNAHNQTGFVQIFALFFLICKEVSMFQRSLRLISIALLFALGITALAPAHTAYAAGYVVNTLADENKANDGACSLREAINSANNAGNGDCGPNSPAGDVIAFSVSGAIHLGSTLYIAPGQGSLNINGANKITVSGDTNNDGNGDVRVLYVDQGADLALVNLTIDLGAAGAFSGGGAVNLGTLTLVHSTFSKNSATTGGGVDNAGKFSSFDSTFTNNQADNTSVGGGIYNSPEGTLFIIHNSFVNNSADVGGGGIANEGTATIADSTFSGNTASIPNGQGGGILNSYRGSLTILRSTFFGNSADHGGGLYAAGQVTVTGSTFSNNSGDSDGGGITNYGTLRIDRSTFVNNSASVSSPIPGDGGGIFNGNGFDGIGKLIATRSAFIRNNAGRGAGLYSESYTQIYNSTFAENDAFNTGEGGGIYYDSAGGVLVLDYSTLSDNRATTLGGGIFIANSDVTGGGGGSHAYISFTIVANSPSGGNCSGSFFWQFDNLATDNTCSGFAQVTPAQLNFGALTGAPAYFPLNAGSVAIDAGDTLLCAAAFVNNQSQNGVTRPQDGDGDGVAVCDIGSYEAQR
jgi:CSLREA domain-containing protein